MECQKIRKVKVGMVRNLYPRRGTDNGTTICRQHSTFWIKEGYDSQVRFSAFSIRKGREGYPQHELPSFMPESHAPAIRGFFALDQWRIDETMARQRGPDSAHVGPCRLGHLFDFKRDVVDGVRQTDRPFRADQANPERKP